MSFRAAIAEARGNTSAFQRQWPRGSRRSRSITPFYGLPRPSRDFPDVAGWRCMGASLPNARASSIACTVRVHRGASFVNRGRRSSVHSRLPACRNQGRAWITAKSAPVDRTGMAERGPQRPILRRSSRASQLWRHGAFYRPTAGDTPKSLTRSQARNTPSGKNDGQFSRPLLTKLKLKSAECSLYFIQEFANGPIRK